MDRSNFYSQRTTAWTFVKCINIFEPSFFLASWMTGQYFRVTRQAKVEDNLKTLEERSKALLDSFEIRTGVLLGQVSGGNSFCYISIPTSSNGKRQPIVIHQGIYPLYDLSLNIVDLEVFDQIIGNDDYLSNKHLSERFISIGSLLPNHTLSIGHDFFGTGESRKFNIFWAARNGFFSQLLRCKKVDGIWLYATKVIRDGTLIESIDEKYPRNSEGNVDWS